MPKLLFVYNADSGFMNGVFDFFHKMMKPSKYSCDLCAITYKTIGMRKAWKNYLKSLRIEKDFLYKDEFKKQYPQYSEIELPAVFLLDNNDLILIISSIELKNADLNELIRLLKEQIVSSQIDA